MKGYSTTLSCWGGETYPPAQNGFASCCCKQVKTIRAIGGLHHCYPCSTAVSPVCCRPGDNTLPRMVNINLNCQIVNSDTLSSQDSGWRIVIMTAIRCWRLLLHAHCCERAAVMSNYCSCIYYAWHELTFSEKGRESQTFRSWPDNPT